MSWTPTEYANLVAVLAAGDHGETARILGAAIDREVASARWAADTVRGEGDATTATKLSQPAPLQTVRSFGTAYQISPDFPALVIYTVQLSVTAPLLSSQDVTVQLFHDPGNPPTVQDGQLYLKSSQLAGLSLVSMQTVQQQLLTAWIPAGDYVQMTASGAGIATLISSTELLFR